jgi:hypothetical protein
MPKQPGADEPKLFRWLSPQAATAKLYDACLAELVREYGRPLLPNIVAYRQGFQAMDISEGARMLFQRSFEYRSSRSCFNIFGAQIDILAAFEYVPITLLYAALQARGVPHVVIIGLVTPLLGRSLHISVAGRPILVIKLGRSLITGGQASGELFNTVMDYVLRPLLQRWMQNGWTLEVDEDKTALGVTTFADNFCILSHRYDFLRFIVTDIIHALEDHGFLPKPSSLLLLASVSGQETLLREYGTTKPPLEVHGRGAKYEFQWTELWILLGTGIDSRGSDVAAFEYRAERAALVWGRERCILLSRVVSARDRLQRMECTVLSSLLYGGAGWRLTGREAQRLASEEIVCAKRTLYLFRKPDQDWKHHMSSSKFFVLNALASSNLDPVPNRQLRAHHRWMGHLARQDPMESLAAFAIRLRPKADWRAYQAIVAVSSRPPGGHQLVHGNVGRPRVYDDYVESFHGQHWPVVAANRSQWRGLEDDFVRSLCHRFRRDGAAGHADETSELEVIRSLEVESQAQVESRKRANATPTSNAGSAPNPHPWAEPGNSQWADAGILRVLPKTKAPAYNPRDAKPTHNDWIFAKKVIQRHFLDCAIVGEHLATESKRLAVAAALRRTVSERKFFQIIVAGDCKPVFDSLAGEAQICDHALAAAEVRRTLQIHAKIIESLRPPTYRTLGSHFWWTERSGNKGPDHLANLVLDHDLPTLERWNNEAIPRIFDLLLIMAARPYDPATWPAICVRIDAAFRHSQQDRGTICASSGAFLLEILEHSESHSTLRTPLGFLARTFSTPARTVERAPLMHDAFHAEAHTARAAVQFFWDFLSDLTSRLFQVPG